MFALSSLHLVQNAALELYVPGAWYVFARMGGARCVWFNAELLGGFSGCYPVFIASCTHHFARRYQNASEAASRSLLSSLAGIGLVRGMRVSRIGECVLGETCLRR